MALANGGRRVVVGERQPSAQLVALTLLAATAVLAPLAHASPTDPVWIWGFYDTLAKPAEPSAFPVDLDRLVRSRVELWEQQAADQQITIDVVGAVTADGCVRIRDGDRVAQIFDNLIANAVDALTGRGGRITISIKCPSAAEVLITVADTGPGVLSHLVDRLFEPFFTTHPGGTGLGLFLSAELAHALDGEIRYRGRPDGGASFEVRLPC